MNAPQGTWSVVSQSPRNRADATGNVVAGYDIAFVSAGGHPGTVFVPSSQYTATNVKAIIDPVAAELDAVGRLTGNS